MRKAITLLTALTATAASVASFATLAESPDWRYVEGGYSKMDFDDNESFEPDGFVLSSKYLLNSNIYLNGEYSNFEEGSFDFDMLTLGAGYRMPLNATTDAYFGANFERIDGDVDDETGYSVNAGVRSMVTEQVELLGEVGYYDVEDGDATFKVGANYYITPQWAVGANYKLMDDLDIMQVTARYSF
ncbi:opacity protein-like surface antigen [Alteromonas sp. 76-1]|jgi:opacity protein-like surface antigen|uniref:outer membrane beta-barrel protein n=1 Tax=Alteromonas sp. 76-1 TaxID=2358187 RepID=UPI000FD16D94|nr:outer membrane beta-barrel protein [Alteromonas sp. 76-1]VEL98961.1 opacity protein-like surface antigen [Alteromonas sp. 76-1]